MAEPTPEMIAMASISRSKAMQNDELLPVTQADRERAASFMDECAPYLGDCGMKNSVHLALVQAFARHRTAHSGEGRSNGAGEDVERLVRIFRSLPLHGDAGCDKLTDDEWRQVALAALTDISLSAPQGEVERLREALEKCATGLEGLSAQNTADPLLQDWADALAGQARAALAHKDVNANIGGTDA